MIFLTKGLWLSLSQTQDVSLLDSGLTTLKSYTLGRHVKLIDSVKYYQQPLAKRARSTNANKKKRISSLFLDYLACTHPYYRKFFLDLGEENLEFALECLSSGKGGFSYEVMMGFNSLSATPKIVISGTSKLFTLGSGMKESLRTNQMAVENCLKCSR